MNKILRFGVLCFLMVMTLNASGQIKLKDKVKKTEYSVDQRSDQGIERGLDAIQNGLGKALKKKDNTQQGIEGEQDPGQNQQNGDQGQQNDQQNQSEPQLSQNGQQQEQTQLQSFSKYDFVPGEKVIFYDDFSQDAIGDFPALWNTNGSAEVVTTNLYPGNWMKFVTDEAIWTDKLLALPENYTIEFDVVPIQGSEGGMGGYGFRLMQSINANAFDYGAVPGKAGLYYTVEYFGRPGYRTYINDGEGEELGLTGYKDDDDLYQKENQKYHMAVWIQKSRVRIYQNETKLFDLPKAFSVASVIMDRIRFEYGAAMISNVRIAVGAPDTRNKLITEGKLVTYGIYFDVNKDVVKPESYGTLKEIATVLKDNPGVRVKIIGHTDSDGADAANLDLSKRRAASVKNELAKTFGVDASGMETDGMGESQPVAPNDTPVNKALNRRVEFIKL